MNIVQEALEEASEILSLSPWVESSLVEKALSALEFGELVVVDGKRLDECIKTAMRCPQPFSGSCPYGVMMNSDDDDTICDTCWKAYLQGKDGE